MDSIKEVESVYNSLRLTEASQALVGLAILIALFAVINKFIKAYKEAFTDGEKPASAKHFFNLFYVYIYCVGAIAITPVVFHFVEEVLGMFQDEMVERYSGYLGDTILQAMEKFEQEYAQESEKVGFLDIEGQLMLLLHNLNLQIFTFGLMCHKYVFYVFVTGRYLYLLLLQMVAPFAIYAWIDDSTRHYTQSFLKNLFICYMMIPAFLVAGVFSDELSKVIGASMGMKSEINTAVIFLALFFKIYLLGKAGKYVHQLI